MKHSKSDAKELEKLGITPAVEMPPHSFLSSGNRALDCAISGKLEGGGYPLGRIVELYGDPATGKSLLVAQVIARAQKEGWWILLDDTEGALDRDFIQKLGVDLEGGLWLAESETVQGHFKRVAKFVNYVRARDTTTPILICLDSLAALSTDHEREKPEEVVGSDPGEFPDLSFEKKDMSKAAIVKAGFRILGLRFKKQDVLYLVTNHTIANVGGYGPKFTTPGGGGPKFHASVRVQLDKGCTYKNDEGILGHQIVGTVVKNRIAPPYKRAQFDLYYASGMQYESGVADLLLKRGFVKEVSKGWFEWAGEKDKKYRMKELEDKGPELIKWVLEQKDPGTDAQVVEMPPVQMM